MRAFGDNAFVDNSSRPKPTLRSFYDHTDVRRRKEKKNLHHSFLIRWSSIVVARL